MDTPARPDWKPGTMIYPLPALLATCGASPEEWNMLTVAWTGTICSNPPMCYISVRPERHSYALLRKYMEFTLCLTTENMVRATDWAGVRSGADYNKWQQTGLTPIPGVTVKSPSIQESPLAIECRVKEAMSLGSHDMFIADVLNLRPDPAYLDAGTGRFDLAAARPLVYLHGHYYSLGEILGHFGFSVRKKP